MLSTQATSILDADSDQRDTQQLTAVVWNMHMVDSTLNLFPSRLHPPSRNLVARCWSRSANDIRSIHHGRAEGTLKNGTGFIAGTYSQLRECQCYLKFAR